MRRTLIIMASISVVLQACVPGAPTGAGAAGGARGIAGEAIAVTTLADPPMSAMVDAAAPVVAGSADPAGVPPATRPEPRPDSAAQPAAAAPAPDPAAVLEIPKSREQLRCERAGGRWSLIGGGAGRSCVMPTRDGGKSCSREGQCEGQCLARSRTCAPFDPLWGCNDVLQDDGRRVTLCLN